MGSVFFFTQRMFKVHPFCCIWLYFIHFITNTIPSFDYTGLFLSPTAEGHMGLLQTMLLRMDVLLVSSKALQTTVWAYLSLPRSYWPDSPSKSPACTSTQPVG